MLSVIILSGIMGSIFMLSVIMLGWVWRLPWTHGTEQNDILHNIIRHYEMQHDTALHEKTALRISDQQLMLC